MYDLLKGIRVLDVATWTLVPVAGTVLSDWGADVIKVEDPVRGDPQRGLFNSMTPSDGPNPMLEIPNRGKRSIGINLKSEAGRGLFLRLVERSDVVLTNMREEPLRRLKIDVDTLRQYNPGLIYARASGYGSEGPDAEKGGFDQAAAWARGGMAYQLSLGQGEPPMMPGSFGDLVGGLALAGAVAAAIAKRALTGEPSEVDVALYGIGMWLMSHSITAAPMGLASHASSRKSPLNPLVNHYRTQDDRWIELVMLQADRWWPDLCRRLGRPDLVDHPSFASFETRLDNMSECIEILDGVFATRTLAEWKSALDGSEGVWDAIQSPKEVSVDPQVLANGFFPEVDYWGQGTYRVVASPAQFDGRPLEGLTAAPELGQNTEEILENELDLTWDEINDLKASGAIS